MGGFYLAPPTRMDIKNICKKKIKNESEQMLNVSGTTLATTGRYPLKKLKDSKRGN